jgi:hypothetical protein
MDEEEFSEEEDIEDREYRLSAAGYQRILTWMRFQTQMCELEHGNSPEACDDEAHQIAFLLVFVVVPVMDFLGISTEQDVESIDAPLLIEESDDEEDESS